MCVYASVLFISALSSFSTTAVKTRVMLPVTTLTVAFRATATGAEEGHVCAEKNAE